MSKCTPLASALLIAVASQTSAQVVRTGSGPDAASIQAVVDQYRSDLGALNPNEIGSFGTGRREIDWDGVPDAFSAPNNLPPDFFNVNSPRGVEFSTRGFGVQVSADDDSPDGKAPRFGNLNSTYPDIFQVFSPQRLFSEIDLDDNVVDVSFFIPGTDVPALSRGFGAVFTDVDLASTTTLEFFDANKNSLGTFEAPVANEGLSFVGVSFNRPIVRRVVIQSGNSPLGPDDGEEIIVRQLPADVVVMDDFIYGEPVVPEPQTAALAVAGMVSMFLGRWRHSFIGR